MIDKADQCLQFLVFYVYKRKQVKKSRIWKPKLFAFESREHTVFVVGLSFLRQQNYQICFYHGWTLTFVKTKQNKKPASIEMIM